MKKLTATLLPLLLMTQIAATTAAKQKGDWNYVKALVNTSIAVKTKDGDTHFGLLQSVDDAGLEVQIAGHDDFTPQRIGLRRDEIARVWTAKLRFSEKHVGKGALVGAGAGLGVAYLIALVLYAKRSDDPAIGLAAFPLYGAVIGGVIGKLFWKKKHKKHELVYSV